MNAEQQQYERITREELADLEEGDTLAIALSAHSSDTVPDCAVYDTDNHKTLLVGEFEGLRDYQRQSILEYDRPMVDIRIRGEDGFTARYSMDNGYIHHSEYDHDAGKVAGLFVPA